MSRHVLVARLDNNGDVLLAGPAIRAVASASAFVSPSESRSATT